MSSDNSRILQFGDEAIKLGPDGHLADPGQWSEALAAEMARREGLELGELHWWMIRFVRRHWLEYGTPPLLRVIVKAMRNDAGRQDASSRTLYRLFPEGPIREACRLAGLPRPEACI